MIYLIITITLDVLLSNIIPTTYQNITYLFPSILISSLPVLYLKINNKKLFIIILILIGIFYDLLYSDLSLINLYFFTIYGLIIYNYYKKRKENIINIIILSIIGVISYDIFIFFILVIGKYQNLVIDDLYYKIKNTLFINIIYILLSITTLKSRILTNNKRKKKVF